MSDIKNSVRPIEKAEMCVFIDEDYRTSTIIKNRYNIGEIDINKPSKSVETLERETVIVATYGYNSVLKKPFEFLYEFGYYTEHGCVVYRQGERNMEDACAFKLEQIRIATDQDLKRYSWGH